MKWGWLLLIGLLWQAPADRLILTPDLQGTYVINGISVTLGYGTVLDATTLNLQPTASGIDVQVSAPLTSTKIPFLLQDQRGSYIVDAPGEVTPIPAGMYLIYFDTVQVFAQHETIRSALYALGMLENYQRDLPITRTRPNWSVDMLFAGADRRVLITDPNRQTANFLAASALPRYADLFQGQIASHPATFQVLGWAESAALPQIVQAMLPQVPPDADLPLPGERLHPLRLALPFDCTGDWWVSWGYHGSSQQNRYAVDFASAAGRGMTQGLPIYAAHEGTLFLKRFGTPDHLIDVGLAARVVHPDGFTSTQYGHLDTSSLTYWQAEALPDFEWVEIGAVVPGQLIGYAGSTGYSTGAHLHFVLWTHDQSIYRPQFETWGEVQRGLRINAEDRQDCDHYQEQEQ